jgi:hypothetical protein
MTILILVAAIFVIVGLATKVKELEKEIENIKEFVHMPPKAE